MSTTTTWLDTKNPTQVEAALVKFRNDTGPVAESARQYGGGDERFALWLRIAASKCAAATGVTIFDLEDFTWRDSYDAGEAPSAAVREALANDSTYSSFFGGEGE